MNAPVRMLSCRGRLCAMYSIYQAAFPPNERMPWLFLCRRAWMKKLRLQAIGRNDETVGMACILQERELCYLLFLAVRPDVRGQGIGSAVLQSLCEQPGRLMIALETQDPLAPNADERLRRLHFYERHGLRLQPWILLENGECYDVMCTGELTAEDYEHLADCGYGKAARRRMDTRLIGKETGKKEESPTGSAGRQR